MDRGSEGDRPERRRTDDDDEVERALERRKVSSGVESAVVSLRGRM